jgi:hypothetical protein
MEFRARFRAPEAAREPLALARALAAYAPAARR